MPDSGWSAFIGAVVGGVGSIVSAFGAGLLANRRARTARDDRISATALLIQDDFMHYQATLAHALDRCTWWRPAELLDRQATIDDRKEVWAALADEETRQVANAQGWMDILIGRRNELPGAEPPLSAVDAETMRVTFRELDHGRRSLATLARRTATDFRHSRVLETLERCHTVDELLDRGRCAEA